MTWFQDLFATAEEIREIREAHQRTITRLNAIRADRDRTKVACNGFADTNIQLAHKVEHGELLLREASRLILILALTSNTPAAERWLEQYDAVLP
jgi:hypothetical protein